MGDVVDFKSTKDRTELKFDSFIDGSAYLKLTVINALAAMDYQPTIEGAKEFQHDHDFAETGIIGLEELGILMQVFDTKNFQNILNHINERYREINEMKKEEKKTSTWKIILWLCILLFFAGWGVIDCWFTIYHFVISLF